MSDKQPLLSDVDAAMVVERYRRRIAEHGPTFASLNSGTPDKQRVRHAVHAGALRGDRPAVLDVGCGLGDFQRFLRQRGVECAYTGYDIVPEYVEQCRRTIPEGRFELRNILRDGIEGVHDTVVMSQVFNNRYAESDNLGVIREAIRLAFEHARVSVSIDMLSTYVDYRNAEVFYYSPEEMFGFGRTLTPRVAIRHDYRLHEFCLQLYRPDAPGFVP